MSRNFLVLFLNQIQSDLDTTFQAGGMHRGEGPNLYPQEKLGIPGSRYTSNMKIEFLWSPFIMAAAAEILMV